MAAPIYDRGDLPRFGNHVGSGGAPFRNASNVDTDPTTATLLMKRPDGTTATYGWPSAGADGLLTKEATGRFYRDVSMTQSGTWYWYFAGTGTVTSAAEGSFYVRMSKVL